METSHAQQLETATMDIECPWCNGQAKIEVAGAGAQTPATSICLTCSVQVALAPDPVRRRLATAA